jgi:hypothetical protein
VKFAAAGTLLTTMSAASTACRAPPQISQPMPSARTSSAKAVTEAGVRPNRTARASFGNNARSAARWLRACTPVPMNATTAMSAHARCRAAMAVMAAVRIAVMRLAASSATGIPRAKSLRATSALTFGTPGPGAAMTPVHLTSARPSARAAAGIAWEKSPSRIGRLSFGTVKTSPGGNRSASSIAARASSGANSNRATSRSER